MTWLLPLLAAALAAADPSAALDSHIVKLRQQSRVPALSVALIEDGKLAWARAWGKADAGTLFQAASISKPVAAMAALHMMQHGNFTLDEDVDGKLKSWHLPASGLTASEKVTLRRLLSHSAGLNVHGFPGYAAGQPVPTLAQILNGQPPANTPPIVVEATPGSRWQYSGGGYTVLQQLLTDRIGWPFPQIMQRMVLSRIGMKRSTYEQPLPEALAANAALAHQPDGKPVPGRWHTYPEMAAAGLWTTPSDLALWAIELRETWHGRSNRIIERTTAMEMLRVQSGSYGLGLVLRDGWFAHSGANRGYRARLAMHLESGKGAIVMTNSDAGDRLIESVLERLAAEYRWSQWPRTASGAATHGRRLE